MNIRAMKNEGVMMRITTVIDKDEAPQNSVDPVNRGRSSATPSMSLEKRLIILPKGVESKKIELLPRPLKEAVD